jgi:hypothetical protein
LRQLYANLPVREVILTQIYPGYDNIIARSKQVGRIVKSITYSFERTPLRIFGLSHFVVLKVEVIA